jgi:hypothetical protein
MILYTILMILFALLLIGIVANDIRYIMKPYDD